MFTQPVAAAVAIVMQPGHLKFWPAAAEFMLQPEEVAEMGGVAGDSLGRIMERALGEEGTITNINGLTLATR